MSNTRGQYGRPHGRQFSSSPRSYAVGSQLFHVLELRQRYENASSASVQALLSAIAGAGSVTSTGTNRWEVALRDGAVVRLSWNPEPRVLTATITDKRAVPVEQISTAQRYYEGILAREVDPRLTTFGAVAVGLTLYHSVEDRAQAVKQMAIDWTALYQDLALQVGEIARDPASSSGYRIASKADYDKLNPDPKKVSWFKSYAMPIFRSWNKFKSDQLGTDLTFGGGYVSWTERFTTNWDVYENWIKKLDALKAEAQRQGFKLGVATAAPLPTTVFADVATTVEKGAGAVATGVGDVWNILKYGAYAVLGIGALVAISSVASNLKTGKDPAEKYVQLIREARKPRAPRALPAREQLALAAGEGA
jgi:hypothetical protein